MDFLMEGDSPSFMHLIHTGLEKPGRPDFYNWGGRYEFYQPRMEKWFSEPETRALWTDASDQALGFDGEWYTSNKSTIFRWRESFQNDFEARMDWRIQEFKDANDLPVVNLMTPEFFVAKVGDRIDLSAEGSSDPDGEQLTYQWFYYGEPGEYTISNERTATPLKIENSDSENAYFLIPNAERLGTMHIILEVTVQGSPALTRYKRAIVTVSP